VEDDADALDNAATGTIREGAVCFVFFNMLFSFVTMAGVVNAMDINDGRFTLPLSLPRKSGAGTAGAGGRLASDDPCKYAFTGGFSPLLSH
jgi:hypothetical protein